MSRPDDKTGHEKVVSLIAKSRFPYPDEKRPHWRTFVNSPELTMGIDTAPEPVYPDILVVDEPKGEAVMIGEVETETTVTEERCSEWAKFTSLVPAFYLYVPEDRKDSAEQFLTTKNIRHAGLRGYTYSKDGKLALTAV